MVIDDEKLKLVFINFVGQNFKNENIYEFIFSYDIDIDGEFFDSFPSLGRPKIYDKFIKKVGTLTTDIKFDLAKDSNSFNFNDCVDNIIALAWQNIWGLEKYPDNRLVFKFGTHSLNDVINMLLDINTSLIFAD